MEAAVGRGATRRRLIADRFALRSHLSFPRSLRQDTSAERRMSAWEDRPNRTRRQFTPGVKRDAVELVRTSGRPIAEIARELGIYDSTPGN
jgi:hypothetical protein